MSKRISLDAKLYVDLVHTGTHLSNVFFNFSQDSKRFSKNEREWLRDLQKQWDNSYFALGREYNERAEARRKKK